MEHGVVEAAREAEVEVVEVLEEVAEEAEGVVFERRQDLKGRVMYYARFETLEDTGRIPRSGS